MQSHIHVVRWKTQRSWLCALSDLVTWGTASLLKCDIVLYMNVNLGPWGLFDMPWPDHSTGQECVLTYTWLLHYIYDSSVTHMPWRVMLPNLGHNQVCYQRHVQGGENDGDRHGHKDCTTCSACCNLGPESWMVGATEQVATDQAHIISTKHITW